MSTRTGECCLYLVEREVEHPEENEGDRVPHGSTHHTQEGEGHAGHTQQVHALLHAQAQLGGQLEQGGLPLHELTP